jgi:DNA polymerase (family 10)
MQDRFQIAAALREIGKLLEVKNENPFKAQAYDRGARALENFGGDLDQLIRTKRLTEIPGIGKALASIIEEIYTTAECWMLNQLREELPPGAAELSAVPGLNRKKIVALHDALHIENVADLKTACQKGLVRTVKGFGEKSEAKLLADIEKLETPQSEVPLHRALMEGERVIEYLRAVPSVDRAEIAGAVRRWKETVERVQIVASSNDPKQVLDRILSYPGLSRTSELEEDRCAGPLASGALLEVSLVAPSEFTVALHRATGSSTHLAKLDALEAEERNGSKGKSAGRESSRARDIRDEAEIYARLGLPYIAPEMREDQGEIEAALAGKLPQPVTLEDIRGMTHCHTVYSDGQNTIEEMARAAEAAGMKYITITDHSPTAFYARGLDIDRLRAQWDEIDRVQERVKIKILKGTESDITEPGLLDYPDHILERFDIIIASIHARNKMNSDQMTRRLINVMKQPVFKIWGHPLGRITLSRPPFECRMEEVLDAVAESKAGIEVNGDPRRLDLEPRWIRAARERGIKFLVSTDAHSVGALGYLHFGVAMARRGWLTAGEVLNTRDTEDFMKAVRP